MRNTSLKLLFCTAAALLFGAAQTHAANGAWSQIASDSGLGTTTYGISMTTTGVTPPLPLAKATIAVDHAVLSTSGTASVVARGVMAPAVGKLTAAQLVGQPSGTIVAISNTLTAVTTTGGYGTLTTNNRYAGVAYQVTVPASGQVDVYVTQFTGKAQ